MTIEASQPKPANSPSITEGERRRRQEAVDYAEASMRLEGFTRSPAEQEHVDRFVNGEISLKEYVDAPRQDGHER